MLSSCWTLSPCQCMFADGHFSIFLMFNLKFSKITSALSLEAWTLQQYLQVLHFCLTLINSNILSKAEENQLIYIFYAAMIQASVSKLQIATWAAPNHEYFTWMILEKVQQNKSFSKRTSISHRANKQYAHTLKQTACICFHRSRWDRQLADRWGQHSGERVNSPVRAPRTAPYPHDETAGCTGVADRQGSSHTSHLSYLFRESCSAQSAFCVCARSSCMVRQNKKNQTT